MVTTLNANTRPTQYHRKRIIKKYTNTEHFKYHSVLMFKSDGPTQNEIKFVSTVTVPLPL